MGYCEALGKGEPPWMKLYAAFAKSADMRRDTRSLQQMIAKQFASIDPGDWKVMALGPW